MYSLMLAYLTMHLILKSTDLWSVWIIFILFLEISLACLYKNGAFSESSDVWFRLKYWCPPFLNYFICFSFPKCACSSWWDLFWLFSMPVTILVLVKYFTSDTNMLLWILLMISCGHYHLCWDAYAFFQSKNVHCECISYLKWCCCFLSLPQPGS